MAKAAENLGISQPSLSYAIKKLESELGVPLFEPDGRNIRLTPIGSVYLKYITAS
ncbi:LysR family transcriptional regulator [Lactiplantibacillus plantarum]|nr:LysR family transcriptional regulator [Lactiplantibacillus plantarum]